MTGSVPVLHLITPDRIATGAGFEDRASALFEEAGGRLAIHLRLERATARVLFDLARALAHVADSAGGWCVVNGRPDVAAAARAQAVQLGAGALPAESVRPIVGEAVALGVSVHAVEEVVLAVASGANYIMLGTIYPTASHPGHPGSGATLVRICRSALEGFRPRPPLIAIGGIDERTVREMADAGADGFAVQRAVWEASEPRRAVRSLLDRWDAAR